MIYKNLDIYSLINLSDDKTLICFGAGQQLQKACEEFRDISFFSNIDLIADNDREKRTFTFDGEEKVVNSIETCLKLVEKEPLILITVLNCRDIVNQLNNITELNNSVCCIYAFARNYISRYSLPLNRAENEPLKIPKTIHYCWFGGNPLRDDFKAYIETWRKYCPDYEIVRWDESNYDYKQNEYMYEAYKQRKWAFVSDFVRLDIICRYGGVYFDTDVELLRNIDDLLCDDAFYGFEERGVVNNGLGFGAVAGFALIKEQLMIYDKIRFINDDGSLNLTPGPRYQTRLLQENGLKKNNSLQEIHGMKIYPSDVLSPYDPVKDKFEITDNTYAIHHYAATWLDRVQREKKEMLRREYAELEKLFLTRSGD